MNNVAESATDAWLDLINDLLHFGQDVSPRGERTKEKLCVSRALRMTFPVVEVQARRLSWKFMAAEAMWILNGDDRVETISGFNKKIADFSDDGKTFFGAYGPRVKEQFSHVCRTLMHDTSSRQAVMTLWRPNPPASKDIPCTIALTFQIRHDALHCHAYMRSSDAWLGVPYDWFNFSMIAVNVASVVNTLAPGTIKHLGNLYWTAASSHLYVKNMERAEACLVECLQYRHFPVPSTSFKNADGFEDFMITIRKARDGNARPGWLTG